METGGWTCAGLVGSMWSVALISSIGAQFAFPLRRAGIPMAAMMLSPMQTAHTPEEEYAHLVAQQIAAWEMSFGDLHPSCVDRPPPV